MGESDWRNVREVRFSIANFVFCGKDDTEADKGNGREKLEIKLDGFEAYFEKLGNYEDIVESILLNRHGRNYLRTCNRRCGSYKGKSN